MSHFVFVNASSRDSTSISEGKLYILTILQLKYFDLHKTTDSHCFCFWLLETYYS